MSGPRTAVGELVHLRFHPRPSHDLHRRSWGRLSYGLRLVAPRAGASALPSPEKVIWTIAEYRWSPFRGACPLWGVPCLGALGCLDMGFILGVESAVDKSALYRVRITVPQ